MATANENVADQEIVGNKYDPEADKAAEKKLKELKSANYRAVFGGGAGRLSLIAVGVAFIGIFVVGAYNIFGKKPAPPPSRQAEAAMIPAPGASAGDTFAASEGEAQMRRERNLEAAKEAQASGAAYIAPPVLKPQTDPQPQTDTAAAKPADAPRLSPEEQRREMQAKAQQQASANVIDPSAAAASQRRSQEIAELEKLRQSLKEKEIMPQVMVASGLGWKGEPVKGYGSSYYSLPDRSKEQQAAATAAAANAASTGTAAKTATAKAPVFGMGEECFANLDYCINTDNPSNKVMATIPVCKGYKNVKVSGVYEYKDQAQGVSMTFDKMSIPGQPQLAIQAMGIDDKTGPGIADDVDNHYVRRWGMTAVAAFVSGLGKAAQVPIGTIATSNTGLSTQTTTVQEPMTTARQVKIAAGEVGQQMGNQLQKQGDNVKTTIKVGSPKDGGGCDRGIGVVFLSDVYAEKK